VGTWLAQDLQRAGHELVLDQEAGQRVNVLDGGALKRLIAETRPDGVAHLAAVSFGPDASEDPGRALAVNVGGTLALFEAVRTLEPRPVVLVTGSSDVYGAPAAAELPLRESAPLRPSATYGLSKAAQESVALAASRRDGVPVVVTRSFNHTGPGQRPEFAVPALARRTLAVQRGEARAIRVGNLDVRRDFSDARDVVRAYRLLLEAAAAGRLPEQASVFNVCSGTSRTIRSIVEGLCRLAGVDAAFEVDPQLVRVDDPPEIRGDASALRAAVGWEPTVPFDQTLRDLLASLKENRVSEAMS
jgi:GDP-4-dehydro-6-deoxy-D-mannose reductase